MCSHRCACCNKSQRHFEARCSRSSLQVAAAASTSFCFFFEKSVCGLSVPALDFRHTRSNVTADAPAHRQTADDVLSVYRESLYCSHRACLEII